ncbi:MAG: cupin domain-containing protein [Anaerolineae bacterium]|nr:cupin domain-containing protein [Anaerolineae bacterium]
MQAFHYTDVAAQDVEGCPGVTIRWVIGQNVNAPHFAMRIISLEPGAATEHHEHGWEHEVYVLEGEGIVRDESQRETSIGPGSCVYVPPDQVHHFANTGDTLMRFICVIPNPEG